MNDLLSPPKTEVIDDNKDYLAELTGPGGKYDRTKYQSDEEMYKAIAKGKYLADYTVDVRNKAIDDLRNDYTQLRDQYNAGPKLQELLDQLKSQQQNSNSDETMNANESKEKSNNLDANQIKDLYNQFETEKKQTENFNTVQRKLMERYGENYPSILKQQVDSLGLQSNDINELAKKSPQAFFKILGLDQEPRGESFQTPPSSNRRADSFAPQVQKRDEKYYDNLRKTKPNEYYDPKTQVQMQNDAIAQGWSFFSA